MYSWKRAFAVLSFLVLLLLCTIFTAYAAQTCPDGGGWTKINSGDLSQYPVDGATDYCFKAGTEVYDDLESWQASGKDLSHWSYFISVPTRTPIPSTVPTTTPTPTQEPTDIPKPTRTPRPTTTPEFTETPRPTSPYTVTPGLTGTATVESTPRTATLSPSPGTPCPCVYETVIIQGESDDHIALWAAITLLAGTNAAWMIKRRKLEN